MQFTVGERLGIAPSAVEVRLVAQHALGYFVYGDGKAAGRPPFLLEAKHRGRDVSDAASAALFDPCPIPYDHDFNRITASAACTVLEALASPVPRRDHVPAPRGRLGGYPVIVSQAGVALDLPAAWTVESAEAVNRASLPWDGIAGVDRDGTVHFTDRTAAGLRTLLGRPANELRPADAAVMATALVAAVAPPTPLPAPDRPRTSRPT